MSDQFLAEIRIGGFNFAPQGWATCDGQLMPISQNTALFSLLGTNYGGDGRSTFGLPNLEGSVPMQPGQGPGLSLRDLGEVGGEDNVTLIATEMPLHSHALQASSQPGEDPTPGDEAIARSVGANLYQTTVNQNIVPLDANAVAPSGGSFPHNNLPPYLVLNFIIALVGIFPPRS